MMGGVGAVPIIPPSIPPSLMGGCDGGGIDGGGCDGALGGGDWWGMGVL